LLNAQNGDEENNDRNILNVLKADQKQHQSKLEGQKKKTYMVAGTKEARRSSAIAAKERTASARNNKTEPTANEQLSRPHANKREGESERESCRMMFSLLQDPMSISTSLCEEKDKQLQ
jgi:hypothetical protein